MRASSPHGGSRSDGPGDRSWDVVGHLDSNASIVAYLEAVFEDGDPALIAAALNDVARAKGVHGSDLPENVPLGSVIKIMKALGLELTAKTA